MLNIFSKTSKIQFQDLYSRDGLLAVNQEFEEFFKKEEPEIYSQFLQAQHQNTSKEDLKNILISSSRVLEEFLSSFFGIEKENEKLQLQHSKLSIIYKIKRSFVQRRIAKKFKKEELKKERGEEILKKIDSALLSLKDVSELELRLAELINECLKKETLRKAPEEPSKKEHKIENLELYCAWALLSVEGQEKHKNGTLFKLPPKIDPDNLVNKSPAIRNRDGFKLTDPGFDLNQALGEATYCIFCHNQGKDSCSIGLKDKEDNFKKDQFDADLEGCPLEEKISEMNLLKSEGFSIAALAMAIIDNPMIAGTGHRICNDCMKSCIYQKQKPVDIPQVETRTLKDVLNLPYGFEIYSLLTRWNPLNIENPITKQETGNKVLVAGLGPAGYTLAHYLLNEGHLVVAIDGLKIEPLETQISGIDLNGKRHEFKPIKNINEIYEELDTRPNYGFGGVAEYGITNRWDKNFLKIIRLLLERRTNFQMFGGVRLGSAFDCKDALNELGFDHVALCLGAGWPNIIDIKNNFAKGIRSASDFLMALQLTGAAKEDLLTNLQVRLPIIVVGGGLTAIDTACESVAYYAVQVENFAKRYEILCAQSSKEQVENSWNEEEKQISTEFLDHAKQIKDARKKGENISLLLKKLGGVKILYRKKMDQSPSYRLNHEEVEKALEEGIEFIEETSPTEAVLDKFGHIKELKTIKSATCGTDLTSNNEANIAARSLFVAIGTSPNKAPAYEDKLKFNVKNNNFEAIDYLGNLTPIPKSPKAKNISFMAAREEKAGKMVSFFGDGHPSFAGNVVKAMASAKKGYGAINQALQHLPNSRSECSSRSLPEHQPLRSEGSSWSLPKRFDKLSNNLDLAKRVQHVTPESVTRDGSVNTLNPTVRGESVLACGERVASGGHDPATEVAGQYEDFLNKINQEFSVTVKSLDILSDNVFELTVHAPLLAQKTKIGHIFRLHNYHNLAKKKKNTLLTMEGVAVTAYKIDEQNGLISVIIINTGGSSSLVKNLKTGEPIIFMGPSGSPTKIEENKTVMLIAGGRGVFPLVSLANEYRKNGCKIILFAGFRKEQDLVKKEELEKCSDALILSFEEKDEKIKPTRKSDRIFTGNITDALINYGTGKLGEQNIKYQDIDLIFTMGHEEMMHKISQIRHNQLKDILNPEHVGITNLSNPMQCMLKGVCSQCLQKKTDPKTGKERYFYACISQDQRMDEIDFEFLKNRCNQNSLQEKVTRSWIRNVNCNILTSKND